MVALCPAWVAQQTGDPGNEDNSRKVGGTQFLKKKKKGRKQQQNETRVDTHCHFPTFKDTAVSVLKAVK